MLIAIDVLKYFRGLISGRWTELMDKTMILKIECDPIKSP